MLKPLFRCALVVVSVLLLSSLLPANIIYTSSAPNGVQSFTVDGSTFQFDIHEQYWALNGCGIGCSASEVDISVDSSGSGSGSGIMLQDRNGNIVPGGPVGISGPTSYFSNSGLLLEFEDDPGGHGIAGVWAGEWTSVDPNFGYFGFVVQSADGYHYGWAHAQITGPLTVLSPDTHSGPGGAVALEYAYEACPNETISAGLTSGGATCNGPASRLDTLAAALPSDPPEPTPEPSTYILLAIGLSGLEVFYLSGGRIRVQP